MEGLIHKRGEQWDEPPFSSLSDIVEFVAEFEKIVAEAVPQPPRKVSTQLEYEHGKTDPLSPDELREALADLAPLSSVDRLFAAVEYCDAEGPAAQEDNSAFGALLYFRGGEIRSTTLTVEGRRLPVVEGVRATAKAAIDRYGEAKKQAEVEASARQTRRQATEATKVINEGDSGPPNPPEKRWRQILYNPWTVTVVGGLIVALLAVLASQA
jgi:hypothetical protein